MKRIESLCVLWLACCALSSYGGPEVVARSHSNTVAIAGRILSEETKLPVAAELIVTVEGFSPVTASTDSAGQFTVMIPETSHCKILVNAHGFDTKEETITISETALNYFEIAVMPSFKLTLEGTVFGSEDEQKPLDANLTVFLNSDFVKEDSVAIFSGKYSESFTNFGWYIIDFSAPGYEGAKDTIWVMNNDRKTIHKDYHLVPLDSKLTIVLTNILFKFDSSRLTAASYIELNYLSEFLKRNSSKQVEVDGHTDTTGPLEYNLMLSRARAKSVADYLLAKGVKNDQVVIKAFAGRKPVDSNATVAGKANNRRVELILSDRVVVATNN